MTFEVTPQLAIEIKKEIANCQIIKEFRSVGSNRSLKQMA